MKITAREERREPDQGEGYIYESRILRNQTGPELRDGQLLFQGGIRLELGCRKLEREHREAYAAKRRRLNRIRENIGAGVGMLGFLLLLCAGGTEEISVIVMTGAAGLALMVLGGWLGHAFYGQEENAEWLRRMRERGEVE